MISKLLLLMILAHVLGDYYVQWDWLSEGKKTNGWILLLHVAIYTAVGIAVFAIITPLYTNLFKWILWFAFAHGVIDIFKFVFFRKSQNKKMVYIVDQLLHIVCIAVIAIVAADKGLNIFPYIRLTEIFNDLQISEILLLKYAVLALLLLKPVNVTFKSVFDFDNKKEKQEAKEKSQVNLSTNMESIERLEIIVDAEKVEIIDNKTDEEQKKKPEDGLGAMIGNLERLLIVIFLALGQYTAIGLVLTGKSVIRYNKIDAEYYIIGTFFSIISVIVSYLVIVQIL